MVCTLVYMNVIKNIYIYKISEHGVSIGLGLVKAVM